MKAPGWVMVPLLVAIGLYVAFMPFGTPPAPKPEPAACTIPPGVVALCGEAKREGWYSCIDARSRVFYVKPGDEL